MHILGSKVMVHDIIRWLYLFTNMVVHILGSKVTVHDIIQAFTSHGPSPYTKHIPEHDHGFRKLEYHTVTYFLIPWPLCLFWARR